MTDLISRAEAIHALMSEPPGMNYDFYYAAKIKDLPSADVPGTVSQAELEVLEAEKARADRLAEKLRSVQIENQLLKEALRKMC